MEVAWLSPVFITIVTCALGQVPFRVRELEPNLDRSALSKVTELIQLPSANL